MFGNSCVLKLVLIWCVICAVLVECRRQKKDVHHMIILGNRDKSRLVRSHRYSSGRHKRRPSSKKKHHNYPTYSSEESHSFEKDSSDERPARSKPKRHQNRHSHRPTPSSFYEEDNNVQPFIPLQTFPDVKWQPMSSQELFPQPSTYQNHFRMFPGGYQRGAIHYSQPVPLEITTPYAMPSNHFVSYESTVYPPLNTQTFSTKDAYKPFDYSILEKTEKPVKERDTKTAVTPFSIVVEGSTVKEDKTTVRAWGTRNKGKRGRGSGKFEFGQKENKS